jgi:hypothetical protein
VIVLGIRGLDWLGLVHKACGLAALVCGLVVILRHKGTRAHVARAYGFVASMAAVNGTALAIYDLFGRFGLLRTILGQHRGSASCGDPHAYRPFRFSPAAGERVGVPIAE